MTGPKYLNKRSSFEFIITTANKHLKFSCQSFSNLLLNPFHPRLETYFIFLYFYNEFINKYIYS